MPIQQTHHLTFDARTVTKSYASWDRGEPEREWAGLSLLGTYAPGLAPTPMERGEHNGAPIVVMSRLPGDSLGESPLASQQVAALGRALRLLFAVPLAAVHDIGLGERRDGPSSFRDLVYSSAMEECAPAEAQDPNLVECALHAARTWLEHCTLGPAKLAEHTFGVGDGNLANVLWDGESCRLVDFKDCGVSDPAWELADLIEHPSVRLSRAVRPDHLVRAIGLTRAQRTRWEASRPLFACFWLLRLMPGRSGFGRNPIGSAENQSRHLLSLLSGPE